MAPTAWTTSRSAAERPPRRRPTWPSPPTTGRRSTRSTRPPSPTARRRAASPACGPSTPTVTTGRSSRTCTATTSRPCGTLRSRSPTRLDAPACRSPIPLLHGDGLRQVPRLVDVAAAQPRHVIREELQRHGDDDRRQQLRRGRDLQDVLCEPGDLRVTL